MTNEQINNAVLTELGWIMKGGWWRSPNDAEFGRRIPPDFCEDYNAAAEMRKVIKPSEMKRFIHEMESPYGRYFYPVNAINATPRQQAEAFLKMRGKWEESK